MGVILDADVIIRGERGTFDLAVWLATRPAEQFAMAAITLAELWHGVERATAARRPQRQQYIEALLRSLPVIAYTESTALEHARIWANLRASGKMIGFYDLIVAATAMEQGSELATFNKRHFSLVAGLKIIEPHQ